MQLQGFPTDSHTFARVRRTCKYMYLQHEITHGTAWDYKYHFEVAPPSLLVIISRIQCREVALKPLLFHCLLLHKLKVKEDGGWNQIWRFYVFTKSVLYNQHAHPDPLPTSPHTHLISACLVSVTALLISFSQADTQTNKQTNKKTFCKHVYKPSLHLTKECELTFDLHWCIS